MTAYDRWRTAYPKHWDGDDDEAGEPEDGDDSAELYGEAS